MKTLETKLSTQTTLFAEDMVVLKCWVGCGGQALGRWVLPLPNGLFLQCRVGSGWSLAANLCSVPLFADIHGAAVVSFYSCQEKNLIRGLNWK